MVRGGAIRASPWRTFNKHSELGDGKVDQLKVVYKNCELRADEIRALSLQS